MPMTSHDFNIKLMVFTSLSSVIHLYLHQTLSSCHATRIWHPTSGKRFSVRISNENFIDFHEWILGWQAERPSKGLIARVYWDLHHISPQVPPKRFRFMELLQPLRSRKVFLKSFEVEKCHLRLKISGTIKLNKHQMWSRSAFACCPKAA